MPPLASRLALALAALALSSCSSDAPVRAQRPWQSLDLQVGMRSYDDLEPVEDQTTLGLEYVYERPGDAFGWGLGATWAQQDGSYDDDGSKVEVDADVWEVYAGLRRSFDTSSAVRPYVGLGLTLIGVDAESSGGGGTSSDDDVTTGTYLRAGVLFDLSDAVHLGVDARTVFWTDLDLEGPAKDADHTQLAFVLGFSF
jgi:opacity protein-like surface antigen